MLRVVAIAAPHLCSSAPGRSVLTSRDPASLFNACRRAADLAARRIGPWGESNWAGTRSRRREAILLMHSMAGDEDAFKDLLTRERPNVILIGAMTLCLPGAIACATTARRMLGSDICVVLGGRHASESIYLSQEGSVSHHVSSPLRLMAERRIPPVFDLVIAGQAEYALASFGEAIDRRLRAGESAHITNDDLCEQQMVPGVWIAGRIGSDSSIFTVASRGVPIDHDDMLPACELFGINSAFDVFGGRPTAHVFSSATGGCAFDCAFCSERRSVAGAPRATNQAAERLIAEFHSVARVVREESGGRRCASAFVEDSTILGGSTVSLRRLVNGLATQPPDLLFGGQLTVDQILSMHDALLTELREVGLSYLFVGIETLDPASTGGFSKDTNRSRNKWSRRVELMLEKLDRARIACGAALLFGIGEKHAERLRLIDALRSWQQGLGTPAPISLNWAVQHPLKGDDGGTSYRYLEWAIPSGPFSDAFTQFGEASVAYPLAGQPPPILEDVIEVAAAAASIL